MHQLLPAVVGAGLADYYFPVAHFDFAIQV
jgi:hypothetical protein